MTARSRCMLGILTLVAGCSGAKPEVRTAPNPEASVVIGPGAAGSDVASKKTGASQNASTAARYGIPPGHLPPPGQCRVWMPGEPPGQQKRYKSGECALVQRRVPPGGWLVYRTSGDKKEIVVREYGSGPSELLAIRIFDAVTGALVWEEAGDR